MVCIPILCPHCQSPDVVKNGHNKKGKQRYMCKNAECKHQSFIRDYTNRGCRAEIKEQILLLTVNGNGTRAISRSLKISTNTVTKTLKKKKNHCSK